MFAFASVRDASTERRSGIGIETTRRGPAGRGCSGGRAGEGLGLVVLGAVFGGGRRRIAGPVGRVVERLVADRQGALGGRFSHLAPWRIVGRGLEGRNGLGGRLRLGCRRGLG